MKITGQDQGNSHRDFLYSILICFAFLIVLLYWASIQFFFTLNGNVTWLLIAAERFLNGEILLNSYYETNPPLSFLIYTPFVLISKITGIASPIITTTVTYILVCGSLFLTERILRCFDWLDAIDRYVFIGAFMIGITSVANVFFADREHLMVMAMMPFLLCQYAISKDIKLPRIALFISLSLGTIAFLVKPHYGILPFIILCSRAFQQKRIGVIFDQDFMFLAIGTLLYLCVLFLFFNDYLMLILPDVINLYIHGESFKDTAQAFFPYFMAIFSLLIAESFLEDLDKKTHRFLLFIHFCTLLFCIPALVQFKGYYNHIIPALAFLLPALSFSICIRMKRFLKPQISMSLPIIMVLILSYIAIPLDTDFPKFTDIKKLPLGLYIDKNCPDPCTFFVLHSDIEIINPTAAYTKWEHGTRFPAYWFIPRIDGSEYLQSNGHATTLSKNEVARLKEKYTNFVVEDFEHYKPSLVLIGTDIIVVDDKVFSFLEFFGSDENFQKSFTNKYTKTDEFSFDQGLYFGGTSLEKTEIKHYDVYIRNNFL
ncbi:MAG: hypothetical protein OEY94_01970 [Alphaproteobacteria bacterium]|nr:hypothetical protein [Alphaproteobacteria bacterium]